MPTPHAVLPSAAAAALALALIATVLTAAPAAAQDAAPALVAPPTTFADRTTTLRGTVGPADAGRVVEVQRLDPSRGWVRITSATATATGTFAARWRPRVLGHATLRLAVRGSGDAAAAAAAVPTAETTVMRAARSTWYGPGFYGRRTACGVRLTRRVMGVAHRKLPCGTPVTLALAGRTIVVPVIDRGPFARGVRYDLTAAAAKALGMTGTTTLGALPRPGTQMDPPTAAPAAGTATGGTAYTG